MITEETMAKIILDPGHGGKDPGAVYEGRQEKDDNLSLALRVGELLENEGVDVDFTRMTDVYHTPYEKAQYGNQKDGDLFLSFHRNAAATPNASQGAEVLVYEDEGLKGDLARKINENLEQIGFKNRGVVERKNLVVLRRTGMPSLLIETGFIDNDEDNQLFDEKFEEIANGIANAVLELLKKEDLGSNKLYRVQVAAYQNQSLATAFVRQLQEEGFPAYLVYANGLYKVQVGAFRQVDNAVWMQQQLREAGYQTFLVE